ncbi:MAG TPA: hypothetical protein PKI94_06780 [Candidatus Gastranaerophilaceae bacterium]|nr:hypothetical protein [Candidatus Gastranaerophilaceae bacterium]
MTNAVASAIFCARNVDKTKHGEVGRSAVAVGQAKKVIDSIIQLDKKLGKGPAKAVENILNFSNKSKALQAIGKITKFASDNINPLICVSSGIKVLTSDDKKTTLINETGALSGMFISEKVAKKLLDNMVESKTVKELCEKGIKSADAKGYRTLSKLIKSSPTILKGILFVFASIGGYSIGSKIAKKISSKEKKPAKNENIFAKAPLAEQKVQNKAPEKIEKTVQKEEVEPKKVDVAA